MNEWISVKDRMPDKYEEVIVACASYSRVYAVLYSPKYKLFNATDSCETREEAEKYAFKDVTHWMPMPEPPKEETK